MQEITIAVTDGTNVYTSNGELFPMMPLLNAYRASMLCEACARRGIRQLWFAPLNPHFSFDAAYGWDFREDERGEGKLPSPWVHAFQRGSNREVDLIRPGLDRNSPFRGASSPTDVLHALLLFREHTGVTFHHSASATSRELLLSTPAGHKLQLVPMPEPALNIRTEEPLEWCLPAEAVRRLPEYRYVHAYDKNAAYLGATASLPVGAGQFEHLAGIYDDSTCSLPGYFKIIAHPVPVPNAIPALSPARSVDNTRWVTTPTLAYLKELAGAYPQILDAYVWTDHHQPLTAWYRTLRDARKALRLPNAAVPAQAQQMALAAVKGCYSSFLAGYLCSTTWDRSNDVLYRPDIRHMVIAKARCTLHKTVRRAQEDGAVVLGISGIDTVYLLSNQRDPVLAKPMRLNLGTDQVCYKVKGTWELTPDIRMMLEQDGLSNVSTVKLFMEGPAHERTR